MRKIIFLLLLLPGFIMANDNLKENRSNRIEKVFNDLRADNLQILEDFYHPNVSFEDPIGKVQGIAAMKAYYGEMYKNVKEIRFDFTNEVVEKNTHVVFWIMYLKASGLNSGEEVVLNGNSHIVFDEATNKVSYHRDYFDMGAFIYEHIPVLGFALKKVKGFFKH